MLSMLAMRVMMGLFFVEYDERTGFCYVDKCTGTETGANG